MKVRKKGSDKKIKNKGSKKAKKLVGEKKAKKKGKVQKTPHRGSYKYSAKKLQGLSLKDRMWEQLKSSRFRYINEQLYNMRGKDALNHFLKNKEDFTAYHEGYQKQVEHWPINPVDVIINSIKRSCKNNESIADFGCGEAKLAASLPDLKVFSFDLVSLNPNVLICDIASTPLGNECIDVGVFCLSLMGTNFTDYIVEANRVLKIGGLLKIAEVESRFENVDEFISSMTKYGFANVSKNFTHDLFYFMDFTKQKNIAKKKKKALPVLSLKPCMYKKR